MRTKCCLTTQAAAFAALALCALPCTAAIVVLQIDLPLDQVAEGGRIKVGDVHKARVFYDDTQIDRTTRIVPVLHMQHFIGKWVPEALDAEEMPMGDAWLDLGSRPYRYHYSSSIKSAGERVLVDFREDGRFSIRSEKDQHVIVAGPMVFQVAPISGVDTAQVFKRGKTSAFVMHDVSVYVDKSAADAPLKAPYVDKVRIVYDTVAVDPKTRRTPLLNFQHFIGGKWQPERPNAVAMPMDDAWLDLSAKPYRMRLRAAVVHGQPVIIDVQAKPTELWIRSQSEPKNFIINGPYFIDPRPITGEPAIEAAGGTAVSGK